MLGARPPRCAAPVARARHRGRDRAGQGRCAPTRAAPSAPDRTRCAARSRTRRTMCGRTAGLVLRSTNLTVPHSERTLKAKIPAFSLGMSDCFTVSRSARSRGPRAPAHWRSRAPCRRCSARSRRRRASPASRPAPSRCGWRRTGRRAGRRTRRRPTVSSSEDDEAPHADGDRAAAARVTGAGDTRRWRCRAPRPARRRRTGCGCGRRRSRDRVSSSSGTPGSA